VPEELVPKVKWLDEKIVLRAWNGTTTTNQLAEVVFPLKGKNIKRKVALASSDMLQGKALFAIGQTKHKTRNIITLIL